jgi:hypothetical protein
MAVTIVVRVHGVDVDYCGGRERHATQNVKAVDAHRVGEVVGEGGGAQLGSGDSGAGSKIEVEGNDGDRGMFLFDGRLLFMRCWTFVDIILPCHCRRLLYLAVLQVRLPHLSYRRQHQRPTIKFDTMPPSATFLTPITTSTSINSSSPPASPHHQWYQQCR